jgi:hypothetical protein
MLEILPHLWLLDFGKSLVGLASRGMTQPDEIYTSHCARIPKEQHSLYSLLL